VHYALVAPAVARVSLWFKMRMARKQRKKLKEHKALYKELDGLGVLK
jgi:preprotein translocase subunit YajC